MKRIRFSRCATLRTRHSGDDAKPRLCVRLAASCKRHEVEPWAYLRDVLQRLTLPATPEELRQLFPHRWKPNPGTK
ncbi:MAG: transposase domain-containing protein [Gemmatales bacterium]